METNSNVRTTGQSVNRISRIQDSIIDIKYRLAELYIFATGSRQLQQKFKTDMEDLKKIINQIEIRVKDQDLWCDEMQTEINNIQFRLTNRL